MEINSEFEIKSEVDGVEVVEKFKFKYLSNKLRCSILDIDAKYLKAYKKIMKGVKSADNETLAELQAEADKIQHSEISDEEKIAKMVELQMAGLDLVEEAAIDQDFESAKKIWEHHDSKSIAIFKAVAIPLSDNTKIFSKDDSEFWQNADQGGVSKAVEFFREYYRIGK
jgi:predicted nucleic acid-binding protein